MKRYKNLALVAVALCFVFGIFSILAVTGIAGTWWTALDGIKQWFQQHSGTAMMLSSIMVVLFIAWNLFGLLWSQCFHRIEICSFPCWKKPKSYTDSRTDNHGNCYPYPWKYRRQIELQCYDVADRGAGCNADQTASE